MMKMGITGGIGSGKSIVCRLFEHLDVPVYAADDRARILMNENILIRKELIQRFGQHVYLNQQLNRPYLASIIFKDTQEINFVNNLVHPLVRQDFEHWCLHYHQHLYVIQEAALLFESGGYKTMDILVTVTAPEQMRITRVQKRDTLSEDQVRSRIRNQMADAEKIERSDFVIHNDEQHSVIEQVIAIHQQIQSKN